MSSLDTGQGVFYRLQVVVVGIGAAALGASGRHGGRADVKVVEVVCRAHGMLLHLLQQVGVDDATRDEVRDAALVTWTPVAVIKHSS